MLQQNVIDTVKLKYNEHVYNEFTLIAKKCNFLSKSITKYMYKRVFIANNVRTNLRI